MNYFKKMMGTTKSPPAVSLFEILWSWIGAFLGILSVTLFHYHFLGEGTNLIMIIGSFGASAVLIYGAIKSCHPREIIASSGLFQ